MIKIIAAITRNGALGRDGDLLFHIREDLKRFKALTMGSPIIMGRKTFESFPKGALPGRRNMVITRDPDYTAPSIETFGSVTEAIDTAGRDCFIIGGGSIYEQTIGIADELLLTEIDAEDPQADTFFPAIDPSRWSLNEESECYCDPLTGVSYRFTRYTAQ